MRRLAEARSVPRKTYFGPNALACDNSSSCGRCQLPDSGRIAQTIFYYAVRGIRYVRFGSLADIEINVRLTPKSRHTQRRNRCPLSATHSRI